MAGVPDDAERSGEIGLLYWPSYSNPYQQLFYAAAPPCIRSAPGSIDNALARLAEASGTPVCFHLHWLNAITIDARSAWHARRAARRFLDRLRRFRREGGVVAWTIHNLASHDADHPALDRRIGARAGEVADIVLVHGESILPEARALFPGIAGKELAICHGNYIAAYPNAIRADAARARLGIAADEKVLLCLGAVRPYKGIAEMIHALGRATDPGTKLRLVVAGRPSGVREEELEAAAFRARVVLTHDLREIAPEEMQFFLNAADWMVLPYHRILTSGSALLALSFGVPVIAPRMGLLPELIAHGREGLLYCPDSSIGLEDALREALRTPRDRLARMRRHALARAKAHDWADGQQQLVERIRAAHGARAGIPADDRRRRSRLPAIPWPTRPAAG